MSDNFNTSDVNFELNDVARNKISGAQPYGSYGQYTATGAITDQIIWPDGVYSVPPATGVQMTLVSTSTGDAAGQTGIQSVHIHYLDNLLYERTETLALNGTTPVTTVATNIRFIQCMHMATYGSNKKAVGIISATNGGNTYSQIAAGSKRCASSVRMVPKGKRLFVNALSAGASSGTAAASVLVKFVATYLEGHDYTADSVFLPYSSTALQDSAESIVLPVPVSFTEGIAVGMMCTTDKAATIVGSWFGWLETI